MGDPTPPARSTPESHLARFRETGDPAAIGALFDETGRALFHLALTLAPDEVSAEDAVQETFLVALQEAARHDPARPVLPWLVGILHHKVAGIRRRARRSPDPGRLSSPPGPRDPSRVAAEREERERVRLAIDALPEPYRRAALLRWRHGLEPAEIAALDRTPPGTVRSLLHRARERLRSSIRTLPALAGVPWLRRPRGLAAVRSGLIEAARHGGPRTPWAVPALPGGIVAKTLLALTGAGLFLALAWWILQGNDAGPPASASEVRADLARTAPEGPGHGPDRGRAKPSRDPVDSRTADPVAETTRTTGVVRDEAGRPLGGVEIYAVPAGTDVVPRDSLDIATTAKDGSFSIRVPTGRAMDLVALRQPRYLPGVVALGSRSDAPISITLLTGMRIQGVVTDLDDRPVAGALVRATGTDCDPPRLDPANRPGALGAAASFAFARTDDEGAFTLCGLRPGAYRIKVRKRGFVAGFASPDGRRDVPAGASGVILGLEPLYTLRLAFLDERSGEPVPDVRAIHRTRATLVGEVLTREWFDGGLSAREERRRGRLVFPARISADAASSAARRIELDVSAPGYETVSLRESLRPFGEPGAETCKTVRMRPTVSAFGDLRLTFVRPDDGTPDDFVTSLRIAVSGGGTIERRVERVRGGTVEIPHLPAGPTTVQFAPGGPALQSMWVHDPARVTIPEGGMGTARIRLRRRTDLVGLIARVTDEEGGPVRYATVTVSGQSFVLFHPADHPFYGPKTVHEFAVHAGPLTVIVRKAGYRECHRILEAAAGDSIALILVLERSR